MRRRYIISVLLIAALAATALCAWLALFHSKPGRAFITAQIEKELVDVFGGEAEIGRLGGAPPRSVVLEDVTLSDAGTPWLVVDRINLQWRPLRLFIGDIVVQRFDVIDGRLMRAPPLGDKSEDNSENGERLSLRFPDDLPSIRIDAIRVQNLMGEIGAAPTRLDGSGALVMGGPALDVVFELKSENARDRINLLVNRAHSGKHLIVDAQIASAADGAIAALARLDGPLSLRISGDSPVDDAVIAVKGTLGAYGAIDARLAGDFDHLDALDVNGQFSPGAALDHVGELAEPVRFDLSLEERGRGGALIISELHSALGDIDGVIEWTRSRAVSDNLSGAIHLRLAESYRPRLQEVIGDGFVVNAGARKRSEAYAFDAHIKSAAVEAKIIDGTTDFDSRATGDVTARFSPNNDITLLKEVVEASGRAEIEFDGLLALRDLNIARGDGSSLAGVGAYRFSDKAVQFDGDVRTAPGLASSLVSNIAPSAPIDATFAVRGPLDRFAVEAEIDAPEIDFGGHRAPPITMNIALGGLPNLPTGEVTARARDGDGRLAARLRSSENGRVALSSLEYAGEGFTLSGSGALAPQFEQLEVDLAYEGAAEATPWPGVVLVGAFKAEGALARRADRSALTVSSNALRFNDIAVAGFSFHAEGPSSALDVAMSAAQFQAPRINLVENLGVAARLDLEKGPDLALHDLSGIAGDIQFSLRQTASISLRDGITIDGLSLDWGREGAIALDGAFTDRRWRAALKLNEANVPGADSRVTLELDLDTDTAPLARGAFRMRSLLLENEAPAISGNAVWDGTSLTLTSAKDADAIDMALTAPARLTRDPALGVDFGGAIDGYLRYGGAFEVVAAYLPAELQSIEGALNADFRISGEMSAPRVTGKASIKDGAYTELQSGFSVTGLHAEADAAYEGGKSIVRFLGGARGGAQSANEGKDAISLAGEFTLGEASNLALAVGLNRVRLAADPVSSVRASGRIDLAGALDALAAEGDIVIASLEADIPTNDTAELVPISVIDANAAVSGGDGARKSRNASRLGYDIQISADDRIFIRGRGLESEWSANVKISNHNNEALVLGGMSLRRGAIDFSGRRFELTRGSLQFDRLSPNNPRLDIRAEYAASDGVTAVITVSGRAEAPSIALSSTPSLPSEDVMAIVLFGKPANELTALESLQTAEALAALSGIGPFGNGGGITAFLRKAVGLDLLNIDVDPETGGGSLTVGKYVADGLFVSATQDARGENGSVRLEYRITDSITVETEVEQTGDQTVSANWKRDF